MESGADSVGSPPSPSTSKHLAEMGLKWVKRGLKLVKFRIWTMCLASWRPGVQAWRPSAQSTRCPPTTPTAAPRPPRPTPRGRCWRSCGRRSSTSTASAWSRPPSCAVGCWGPGVGILAVFLGSVTGVATQWVMDNGQWVGRFGGEEFNPPGAHGLVWPKLSAFKYPARFFPQPRLLPEQPLLEGTPSSTRLCQANACILHGAQSAFGILCPFFSLMAASPPPLNGKLDGWRWGWTLKAFCPAPPPSPSLRHWVSTAVRLPRQDGGRGPGGPGAHAVRGPPAVHPGRCSVGMAAWQPPPPKSGLCQPTLGSRPKAPGAPKCPFL